ncbi:hypothetical protein ACU8V7_27790 [Zobellia nedashkovskayae]
MSKIKCAQLCGNSKRTEVNIENLKGYGHFDNISDTIESRLDTEPSI